MNHQDNKKLALRYIEAWDRAGKVLAQERINRIKEADTQSFIQMTSGMVTAYFQKNATRKSSGLVEQQHYLRKAKHAGTG